MFAFFEALAVNPFLRWALFSGLAACVASGVVGTYVVIKRVVFISGSIAHSVLGGIGFALWLKRAQGYTWIEPIYGAIVAALLSAMLLGWVHLHYRQREDSIIAALWSIGMAFGVMFIAFTPGFNIELSDFLIGNIMWTSFADFITICVLDVLVLGLVLLYHKKFLVLCFDEDQAKLQGLSVNALYLLLLSLIALTVVLLVHIVGIILVITMLTIPATIANLFVHRLSKMMFWAVILGALFCVLGMVIAYYANAPAGATIALLAGLSYIVALLLGKHLKK